MNNFHEVVPDPKRMVEGLRDTGYEFITAIADVVDNSIAADAETISIQPILDLRGNVSIVIADNGIGMNQDELINALKYGSEPRKVKASLGKFGLGLKTASTAFCRRLVLISKTSKSDLLTASWDLDHVATSNKWEVEIDVPSKEQLEIFKKNIGDHSGTIVIWEKVDRLLKKYTQPSGQAARKSLEKNVNELKKHLAMVFQRYLDVNDNRAKNITMFMNGEKIEPWDPFSKGFSNLINKAQYDVEMPDGSISKFEIKAYVLPRKEEFPNNEEAEKANISNELQGVYIYRENRLINGPDWLKMFTKEPHGSLLRVEFNFDHQLDEAFHIDIKKSQILLNETVYDVVKSFLTPARRQAQETYRKGRAKTTPEAAKNGHQESNRNIETKEGEVNQPVVDSVDPTKDEANITNSQGTARIKLKITSATRPKEVFVQTVESINDGLLWEPCLIDSHIGVCLNTSHPYYQKVYVPNITEGVTIQGMDALMWGLSISELNCVTESTKNLFQELRYEVSRNLRKLVEDLPDPESGD